MEESSAPLRRVIFELPNEHVPELMAVLGDFALEHNVGINFEENESSHATPSLTLEAQPQHALYNSKLVTWVIDPETKVKEAIITLANLQAFAIEKNGHSMSGTRLYNSLAKGPQWESKRGGEGKFDSVATVDEDGNFAIRADQAHQLLAYLDKPALMTFHRLRGGLQDFYTEFCDDLFLDGKQE
jgi:hypothetical protein